MKSTAQDKDFKYKCICDWSKDDEYGFIPNTECPVHGKATKEMLSKTVPVERNPAHYCMGDCGKHLGHRGFCSTKCHNEFYDGQNSQIKGDTK